MESISSESKLRQIFVRLLDGKSLTLRFTNPEASGHVIKQRVFDFTKIPIHSQRLIANGYQVDDDSVISDSQFTFHLVLRLPGGKGGFGSLLRGAATKAGQKKTNNFDACRDMSGRRLRHVNAEKKLEEWKMEEEERRLEKIAEEFIKKAVKKGKKGVGDGAAEKYVEKYREESAKCVAAVEEAFREACFPGKGKRKEKVAVEAVDAKRLKIWKGKRKMGEVDGETDDESSDDEEEGSDKSIVLNNGNHSDSSKEAEDIILNNGNHSDSSKEAEGSLDSLPGGEKDGGCSADASCESGDEKENDSVVKQGSKSGQSGEIAADEGVGVSEAKVQCEMVRQSASLSPSDSVEVSAGEMLETNGKNNAGHSENFNLASEGISEVETTVTGANKLDFKSESNEETTVSKVNTPINLDDYNSAAELEVLGMERLKDELQAQGLKCGGTLHERAARLFLLKYTALEKLPKKLFAKK